MKSLIGKDGKSRKSGATLLVVVYFAEKPCFPYVVAEKQRAAVPSLGWVHGRVV
jgi:hypothetical protein